MSQETVKIAFPFRFLHVFDGLKEVVFTFWKTETENGVINVDLFAFREKAPHILRFIEAFLVLLQSRNIVFYLKLATYVCDLFV